MVATEIYLSLILMGCRPSPAVGPYCPRSRSKAQSHGPLSMFRVTLVLTFGLFYRLKQFFLKCSVLLALSFVLDSQRSYNQKLRHTYVSDTVDVPLSPIPTISVMNITAIPATSLQTTAISTTMVTVTLAMSSQKPTGTSIIVTAHWLDRFGHVR